MPAAAAGWAQESAFTGALSIQTFRIAGDPDGLQIAAWNQYYENRIWMSNRTAGEAWSAPVGSPVGTNQPTLLEVAVAPSAGVAVVTWSEAAYSAGPLKAAVYTTLGGWTAPAQLDAGNAYSIPEAHPAIDNAGRIVVAWAQQNTVTYTYSAWARTFIVGTGWSPATQIDAGGSPTGVRLAGSASGNFMAVWTATQRIYARPYSFTTGWGSVTGPLDSGGSALYPNVVAASDGSWVAAWAQYTTNPFSVFVNRNATGSAWAGPVQLADATNGTQYTPLLAAGGNGNVTVMWPGTRSGTTDLLASRFTAAGGGWGPTFAVDSGAGPVSAARLVRASGDIMRAVWVQGDGSSASVWTAAQAPGGAWGTPELVECGLAAASDPDVALAASGRAEVVFEYTAWGSTMAWSNTRDPSSSDSLGRLVVTSPLDGATVSAPSVWVAGAARSDAALSVNGQAAAIAANGSFGMQVPLMPGANTLEFTLTMPCGITRTASVAVTYEAPADSSGARVDALEEQLNNSQANVTAARAAVAAVTADLASAQANLAAQRAALDLLHGELNATSASLDGAKANLTRLDGQVAALQANGGTGSQSAASSTSSAITTIVAVLAGLGIGLFIGGRRAGVRTETRSSEVKDRPSEDPPKKPADDGKHKE
jgi:hypothetical protein